MQENVIPLKKPEWQQINMRASSRLQMLAQDVYYQELTLDGMAEAIEEDADLLRALLKETGHDIRNIVRDYILKRHRAQKAKYAAKENNADIQFGQYPHNLPPDHLTNMSPSDETCSKVPANHAEPSAQAMAAKERTWQRHARRALMQIDGREIREFTIGECRSAGRRKAREGRVLSALGEKLAHLNHTDEVGKIMSDDQIEEVLKETA